MTDPTQLDRIEGKVDDLRQWAFVGTPDTPSMVVRMDRLERSWANKVKAGWVVVTASVAAAMAWVFRRH